MQDRRYNQRIRADLPVLVTLLDSGQETSGNLINISESGVAVLLQNAADPGAMVRLEILGIIFYGHVAHSKAEDAGFRIGIFVEPALLDSSNVVELINSFLVSHGG